MTLLLCLKEVCSDPSSLAFLNIEPLLSDRPGQTQPGERRQGETLTSRDIMGFERDNGGEVVR